jgi:hypothetical protein
MMSHNKSITTNTTTRKAIRIPRNTSDGNNNNFQFMLQQSLINYVNAINHFHQNDGMKLDTKEWVENRMKRLLQATGILDMEVHSVIETNNNNNTSTSIIAGEIVILIQNPLECNLIPTHVAKTLIEASKVRNQRLGITTTTTMPNYIYHCNAWKQDRKDHHVMKFMHAELTPFQLTETSIALHHVHFFATLKPILGVVAPDSIFKPVYLGCESFLGLEYEFFMLNPTAPPPSPSSNNNNIENKL